ncbi:MAG: RidA family protein [Planctomyces sp.]|nr:RidA family protein [Planctomyces sp.]
MQLIANPVLLHRDSVFKPILIFSSLLLCFFGNSPGWFCRVCTGDEPLRYIIPERDAASPFSRSDRLGAVVVGDVPLLHTGQLFPLNADETVLETQFDDLLQQLTSLLNSFGSNQSLLVRVHICCLNDDVASKTRVLLERRFTRDKCPAVTCVVSQLPKPGALLALDAVAVCQTAPSDQVQGTSQGKVLPPGRRIFVAGQAEQSESLSEATAKTLDSLEATLKALGRSRNDIVQLKAFVMPMSDARVVSDTVNSWYQGQSVPPLVLVEWKSSITTPVEIELVAWGGKSQPTDSRIEFLTPPGMTTSPIYSRVVQISSPELIYTDGFLQQTSGDSVDPNSPISGEREVSAMFGALERVLKAGRSDLRHLVKATYYVSTDSSSVALNKLRPNYYDPKRPPSASKAVVTSVGDPALGLLVDMIAIPTQM